MIPTGPRDTWEEQARAIVQRGYPDVADLLPDLVQWLQDLNWPGALIVGEFLVQIGAPVLPHLKTILAESDDRMWQYWIITRVVTQLEPHLVTELVPELKALAALEDDDGVGAAARAALEARTAPATVTLYRPMGQKELDLIRQSEWRAFPPRLPFQPIFYPVLNEEYATIIAREWNTADEASGHVGYVTRFQVWADFLGKYPVKTVGSRAHQELWIPAEDLAELNANIIGRIEVIAEYRRQTGGRA